MLVVRGKDSEETALPNLSHIATFEASRRKKKKVRRGRKHPLSARVPPHTPKTKRTRTLHRTLPTAPRTSQRRGCARVRSRAVCSRRGEFQTPWARNKLFTLNRATGAFDGHGDLPQVRGTLGARHSRPHAVPQVQPHVPHHRLRAALCRAGRSWRFLRGREQARGLPKGEQPSILSPSFRFLSPRFVVQSRCRCMARTRVP